MNTTRAWRLAIIAALAAPLTAVGGPATADADPVTIDLTLRPSLVGGAANSVTATAADAAPGFGDGSFVAAAVASPQKTDIPMSPTILFGRDVSVGEIERISYWTKTGATHTADPRDWYVTIYTKPYVGDVSSATWYGDRYGTEPYFSANLADPADTWNTWTTDGASNTLRFFESTAGAPGATFGGYTDPHWADFVAANGLSGFARSTQQIQQISVGTGSAWAAGFTGQLDGLTIELTDGSVTTVDFEANTPVCTTVCYVDDSGNDLNGGASADDPMKTVQAAIDRVSANGEVRLLPGTYSETAANSAPTSIAGTYQFGLFFGSAKPGISVIGVDESDIAITDADAVQATITTNATNSFGYSGIFVEAADTTIQGVEIGPNAAGDNKTIEVVANDFTLQYSRLDIPAGGSVYINDFSALGDVVQSYHVLDNVMLHGTSIDISSGAGNLGPVSGREILRNEFDVAGNTWAVVSFNGAGGVPWYTLPVGGAIVQDNTFTGAGGQYIRARGDYHEEQFDWESYWEDNTYDKAAVALVTTSPFDVRSYEYDSAPYTFTNVRRIGATIQGEVANTVAGDTVWAKAGTYPESVTIPHTLTLDGAGMGSTIIDGSLTGNGITIANGVTGVDVSDLTVQEFEYGVYMVGSSMSDISFTDVASNGSTRHGFWVAGVGAKSDLTFTRVTANNNGIPGNSGRGIWIIDGEKTNISITDGQFNGNNLVGIDVSDGTATGVTITGNEVVGNGDSGIALLGAQGPGDNLVAENTVTNNGRYGIEIKNSTGSQLISGGGALVVRDNVVSRTTAATDLRDHAGILVMRRVPGPDNADQPSGAVIIGNTVTGYRADAAGSTGEGFGIVVAGTGHNVNHNIVSNNDVGIQVQAGNTANVQSTPFFDRDDAAVSSALVNRNSITGNTVSFRNLGPQTTDATCNWWGSAAGTPPIDGAVTAPWLTTSDLDGPCADPTVGVTAAPSFVYEGGTAGFNITLSQDPQSPVTVSYATGDGTASTSWAQVGGADYSARSGAVTFYPGGPLTQTVGVPTRNDSTDEPNETFELVLTDVVGATITPASAVAVKTIIDNDKAPKVTIKDATVTEGNPFSGSPTKTITFQVRLGTASAQDVSVDWSTRNGTGSSGAVGGVSSGDFVSASGTLVIPAGSKTGTVTVTIRKDRTRENTEYFFVDLTNPVNGTFGDATGRGTIRNDD